MNRTAMDGIIPDPGREKSRAPYEDKLNVPYKEYNPNGNKAEGNMTARRTANGRSTCRPAARCRKLGSMLDKRRNSSQLSGTSYPDSDFNRKGGRRQGPSPSPDRPGEGGRPLWLSGERDGGPKFLNNIRSASYHHFGQRGGRSIPPYTCIRRSPSQREPRAPPPKETHHRETTPTATLLAAAEQALAKRRLPSRRMGKGKYFGNAVLTRNMRGRILPRATKGYFIEEFFKKLQSEKTYEANGNQGNHDTACTFRRLRARVGRGQELLSDGGRG